MDHKFKASETNQARLMLRSYKDKTAGVFSDALDSGGLTTQTLSSAIGQFFDSLLDLPDGTACKSGCSYCCHLRVGVSIPEAIVTFLQIKANTTDAGYDYFKNRVITTTTEGDILSESFWLHSKTPCPFLNVNNQRLCMIYELRPFSCRAFHSTDRDICEKGFNEKEAVKIPCFPMYRAFTDVHTTILIQEMKKKGLFSYQVGFIAALAILFKSPDVSTAINEWFQGLDIFKAARLE